MNKVAVQGKTLIIVAGIVLVSIVLMIPTILGVLQDTSPGAAPKNAAVAILVAMIFHLLVLFGFLVVIRLNKQSGKLRKGVCIFLGIVLLLLGLIFSDGAFSFLGHKNMLFVSILMFISVFCDIIAAIITFLAMFLKPKNVDQH
jgi:hypothetical protein